MTDSTQDMFDDISFYIGDEDFYTSKSVCDSDISQTDSEADEDDDCDGLLDDQFAGHWSAKVQGQDLRMQAQSMIALITSHFTLRRSKLSIRQIAPVRTKKA